MSILFFAHPSFSQNHNLPLNKAFSFSFDRAVFFSNASIHNSFMPLTEKQANSLDSFSINAVSSLLFSQKTNKSFLSRKLFHEHFISLDTNSIQLTIDPLVNFEIGHDLIEEKNRDLSTFYVNSRGFNVKLSIGDKLSFESSFRENQAVLPFYIDERTKNSGVVFGQGRWKAFGDYGYDYAMASGYISYSPKNWLNIQGGHGKHFIGNGYRSLLLSDLSFNYPYLRLSAFSISNKIQYQSLFSLYQNLNRLESSGAVEGLFERKQASSHYIEYKPNHKVSFAIFESVIFPSLDSNGNSNVKANYWVPIIGLNTLIEGDKNVGNNLWGTNFSLKLLNTLLVYNQLSIIGNNIKKASIQLGAKVFIGDYFLFQSEVNLLNNGAEKVNYFNHYNESLTHPFAQDINEYLGLLQFKKNRLMSRLSYHRFDHSNLGIDLVDFRQSFVINPSFNFSLNAGVRYRLESSSNKSSQATNPISKSESTFIYFGLSTNLQNLYFDY